jgi:hypothetical protein
MRLEGDRRRTVNDRLWPSGCVRSPKRIHSVHAASTWTKKHRFVVSTMGIGLVATLFGRVIDAGAQTSNSSGDVGVAVAGTIQRADVPTTFTTNASVISHQGPLPRDKAYSNDQKQYSGIAVCRGVASANRSETFKNLVTAYAIGPPFEDRSVNQISSNVTVFATVAAAKKFFKAYANPSEGACLKKMAGPRTKNGKDQPSVTVRAVPDTGDQTIDWRTELPQHLPSPVLFDAQWVRNRRTVAYYLFFASGHGPHDVGQKDTDFQEGVQQAVVTSASQRISQALGK